MPQLTETTLFGLALLALVAAFLAWPFVERPGRRAKKVRSAGKATALTERRAQIVAAIADLDFDHAVGKLTDEDYRTTRAALVAEGVEVLHALEPGKARRTAEPEKTPVPRPVPVDALEQEIAARRKAKAAPEAPALEQEIAARRKARAAPEAPAPAPAIPAATGVTPKTKDEAGARKCPKCGRAATPEDVFCPRCGARLPAKSTKKAVA